MILKIRQEIQDISKIENLVTIIIDGQLKKNSFFCFYLSKIRINFGKFSKIKMKSDKFLSKPKIILSLY